MRGRKLGCSNFVFKFSPAVPWTMTRKKKISFLLLISKLRKIKQTCNAAPYNSDKDVWMKSYLNELMNENTQEKISTTVYSFNSLWS